MDLSQEEVHDIRNQIAVAAGAVELSIIYTTRDPVDILKLVDMLEKSLAAIRKIDDFFNTRK
jgi:hypothetical protein